jgi:hypothetical protein
MAFLTTHAPLVLEGLELQRMASPQEKGWTVIVYAYHALYAANCRFVGTQIQNLVSCDSPHCEFRNCEFLCPDSTAVVWENAQPGPRLGITNCLHTGPIVVGNQSPDDWKPASIQLTHNTSVTYILLRLPIEMEKWRRALKGNGANKVLRMDVSGNVFDASSALFALTTDDAVPGAEAILAQGVAWKGEENLFSVRGPFLNLSVSGKGLAPAKPLKDLADWKQFWGSAESGSLTGQVRYHGGNLLAKLATAPETVTPDDFRLRPDSAGYRAGKDGKDLGADVDLVGPGPAYERWKKTPEYQQWLRDTGQVKK